MVWTVRNATPEDDVLLAKHFYQLWRDNDVADDAIRSDWQAVSCEFIDRARQELSFSAFIAEIDGIAVGSVSCQLFAGLYPLVLTDNYRKYGYIWNVYVESAQRGCGIGKDLTQRAIDYLKAIGCTRIFLHASPSGQPVYARIGFESTNEMRLNLF